jgi:hypothetical protein
MNSKSPRLSASMTRAGKWLQVVRPIKRSLPISTSESKSSRLRSASPLGGGGFRSRRGLGVGRSGFGGGAASSFFDYRATARGFGRSAASGFTARLAAATLLAEATEQLELAAAGATAAGFFSRATAGLFDDRATTARLGSGTAGLSRSSTAGLSRSSTARLFDGWATARRLFSSGATAAGFFSFAATAIAATEELLEAGVGLAFHRNGRNHQGHHAQGGTHHKILAHRNPPKKQKTNPIRKTDHGFPAATGHLKRFGHSGGGPQPTFSNNAQTAVPRGRPTWVAGGKTNLQVGK